MNHDITVNIPDGEFCLHEPKKACIFACWSNRHKGYNCKLAHKIMRGGERPRKLKGCPYFGEADEREPENKA